MGQKLESALDITTYIANTNKPSQGIARYHGDLPSKFESDRELFVGYQPREFVRPANGIDQGCEVRGDIRMEGRMVFVRVGIVVLPAVRSIVTGKIIRTLGMNKVNLVKVRV